MSSFFPLSPPAHSCFIGPTVINIHPAAASLSLSIMASPSLSHGDTNLAQGKNPPNCGGSSLGDGFSFSPKLLGMFGTNCFSKMPVKPNRESGRDHYHVHPNRALIGRDIRVPFVSGDCPYGISSDSDASAAACRAYRDPGGRNRDHS